MPYISSLMELLSDLSTRLEGVESSLLRFSGRIFDIEKKIRWIVVSLFAGVGTSTFSMPQMDDLAREIERLHSQLRSFLELLRTDIRDFRNFISADLDGLRLTVRGILSQLDGIRTQL